MDITDMYPDDDADGTGREWLITNGIGGYASSTAIGLNTRKYHGLLVASLNPPVDRKVLLSSLDEEITCGDDVYRLAVHKYPGTVYPEGFRYLQCFSAGETPVFEYLAGDVKLEKKVFMARGRNATLIRYTLSNPDKTDILFRVSPLVTNRDFHTVQREGEMFFGQKPSESGMEIESNGLVLRLDSNLYYHEEPDWYYNFQYCVERERGQSFEEDLFSPGYFEFETGNKTSSLYIAASARPSGINDRYDQRVFERETERQKKLSDACIFKDVFSQRLAKAADSFLVQRSSTGSCSVIAGYHWFADWGRDAMISLPGLTLVTGRFEEARDILTTFASNRSGGLIPNHFPDSAGSPPAYNSVDASLWFIHALGRYYSYTLDAGFIGEMWPAVEEITDKYRQGASSGIGMDDDGLIRHGGQLTWMDVKIGAREITPRNGKACEINALWYNALCTAALLAETIGEDSEEYNVTACTVKKNYDRQYWNAETGCLYDCIPAESHDIGEKDASVRPNQVFAISLPFTMLDRKKEKLILKKIEEELLTPYGLRSLSPYDRRYTGKYEGNQASRDRAYHNGTVWPWLLGPFVTAYTKVHGKSSRQYCRELLLNFEPHLDEAGLGSISEVFDGDSPHRPGGCISQAWSVAETLRAWVEDLEGP